MTIYKLGKNSTLEVTVTKLTVEFNNSETKLSKNNLEILKRLAAKVRAKAKEAK